MVIPDDWQETSIGELGRLRGGVGFPLHFQGRKAAAIPFYKVSDMNLLGNEIYMRDANNWVSEADSRALGAAPLPEGSIVFAKVGAAVFLERKRILTRPSCVDNNMMALIPEVGRSDTRFLHFALQRVRFGDLVSATALPSINASGVSGIVIALPPMKEQEAIAEALGDADAAVEAIDGLIAKKRDVKQAAMQQLLTGRIRLPGFSDDWREVQVGEVALVDPEALGTSTPADYAFRYISLENTFRGRLLGWSEERFGTAPSRARRVLRSGDFLFATVRPNLLGHHLFLRSEPGWVCSTGFSVIRSRSEICGAPFLAQHFFSQRIISQVELLISGSNYPAIKSRDVSRLRLAVPCLQEQGAIAQVLMDMDAEVEALVAERDKMRLVKQGMMQELLSGRVRLV